MTLIGTSTEAQDRTLPALGQGDAAPGSPAVYAAMLRAGDVVDGRLELVSGGGIAFQAYDPTGLKLKEVEIYVPGSARIGFAAPITGTYRVHIARVDVGAGLLLRGEEYGADQAGAAFLLQTSTSAPSVRMAGFQTAPVVRYESPRILQLARDVQADQEAALSGFWAEARQRGGPLVELFEGRALTDPAISPEVAERHVLVTFLWQETYDTRNVLPWFPLTDMRPDDYFLSRLPGTDVWYKTVLMPRGTRMSYSLVPNSRPGELELTSQRDPLNPRLAWDDFPDISLLELDGAPDESWFRRTPTARGTLLERQQFRSTLLGSERPISIYTPPGYSPDGGPYGLLLVFDGVTYLLGFEAVPTLDNLISADRIRPVIACFLTSPGTRQADLGPNASPAFAEAMATELVPWLRKLFPISDNPRDIVIAGYSAGGAAAARIALIRSDVFGNVLSQDGALAGPFGTHPVTIAYRDAPRLPIRFYMDVGLLGNLPFQFPPHELAVVEGPIVGNRHLRDVLLAKGYDVTYRETGGQHNNLHFRATLSEGLLTLLGTGR